MFVTVVGISIYQVLQEIQEYNNMNYRIDHY